MTGEAAFTLTERQRLVHGDPLAEQAYVLLRDAIVRRELPAGARLSVPTMARELNISRSPVREAVARLVSDRLAFAEPRRGAIVASITGEGLKEIYDLREVLEGLAGRLAAERITDAELTTLEGLVRQHREAVTDNDVERPTALDQEFHAAVRRVAANERLAEALDNLQGQILIAMATRRRSRGVDDQAVKDHEAIFDALRDRDPARAETVSRQHIARLRRELGAPVDGDNA